MVELTAARHVASVVDAILWSVASVSFGNESVLICLHEVKLWAKAFASISHLVSVAIVECVSPVVVVWHHNTSKL